jgi:hypothetical protein
VSRERRGASSVVSEELHGPLIELLDLFVDGRVRTSLKHQQLGIANFAHHVVREAGRGDVVGTSECNLCRCRNAFKLSLHIVVQHSI